MEISETRKLLIGSVKSLKRKYVLYLRLFNDFEFKGVKHVCLLKVFFGLRTHYSILVPGEQGDTSLIPDVLGDAERGQLDAE